MEWRPRSGSQSGSGFRWQSPVVVRQQGEAAVGEPESADDSSGETAVVGTATKIKWHLERGDIN